MNEIKEFTINTLTAGVEKQAVIPGYATPFRYKLFRRDGWNTETVKKTEANFLHTVKQMANGGTADENFSTPAIVPNGDNMPGHGESRVAIFSVTSVMVKLDDCVLPYQLNVFTEYTSADVAIAGVRMAAIDDAKADNPTVTGKKAISNTPAKPKPENAPPEQFPTKEVAPGVSAVDLEKAFPRQDQPAEETVAPAPTPTNELTYEPVEEEGNLISEWDYREIETYIEKYANQEVKVRVAGVGRYVYGKTDGSGSYETIDFWRQDGDEKPIYALRVFIDGRDNNYDWKTFKKGDFVDRFLPKPGMDVMKPATVKLKLTVKEVTGERKVYWNFKGMSFDEEIQIVEEGQGAGSPGEAIPW
jgi:hypothetical protein